MKYLSNKRKVSESASHDGLFIIELPDNTFYSINSQRAAILQQFPPDICKDNIWLYNLIIKLRISMKQSWLAEFEKFIKSTYGTY